MDYLFVNAAIKAKHDEFLTPSLFQVLNNLSQKEFLKTLSDYNYGISYVNQTLDNIINEEEKKLLDDLTYWLKSDHPIVKAYRLLNDLVNIKIIMKEIYFNVPERNIYSNLSLYKPTDLYNVIKYGNYTTVEDNLSLFTMINAIPKDISAFDMSNKVTKIVYNYVYENYIAKLDKYFKTYYKVKVTLVNVLSILRLMKLNFSLEVIEDVLLDYGMIDKDILIDALYIKMTPSILNLYVPIEIQKIISLINYDINITELGQQFDLALLDEVANYDFEITTLAPVLNYILKKKYEMKKIRGIYYSSNQK